MMCDETKNLSGPLIKRVFIFIYLLFFYSIQMSFERFEIVKHFSVEGTL